jgi:uncharacterized membrane protein
MTAILEWLFKYRPLLYERGTLGLQPLWPSYITWILIAAAVLGAWLLYRRAAGVLPDSWRYGLSALRAASFLLILLIFLQPVLRLYSAIPQQNFVAVAYDTSRSMEIRDGPGGRSRLETERNILRPGGDSVFEALGSKFKLRYFSFSGSAARTAGFPEDPQPGNITDLERSLTEVSDELSAVPLAGIILLTDGADNHSNDLDGLISRFRSRGIQVYSVGIGSERFSRDVEIVKITAPRKALKDSIVEAEVAVRSSGFAGQRAKLVVTDQGRQLQSLEIELDRDGEVKAHKVLLPGQFAGPRIFKFSVEALPGESILQNNTGTAMVQVEDAHPEILYLEGEPRWEHGFLRRAISEDGNLRLITLLRLADGKFLRQGIESPVTLQEGFPVDRETLFGFKAVILGSVEASYFTFDQLRMISDFVSRRGGGFLMLGGRNSFAQGGYANTPLEDMLPLYLTRKDGKIPEFQNLEFKVRPTGYGLEHPICRISLPEDLNRKRWDSAPNLSGFNPTGGAKPGATVLAKGNIREDPVILAIQRFGKGKAAAFTTDSSWRWRMQRDHADNFHELFWRQMLRWLVSDVPEPLTVVTEKSSYPPDDIAVIHVEANDGSFLPLNNARLSARVKAPSGQITPVPLALEPGRDGRYRGTFRPREEGIHEVVCEEAQGTPDPRSAGIDFLVEESTEEFRQASLNSGLLRRLSSETGGRYYSAGDLDTLTDDISYTNNGVSRLEEKDLWDMPFLFLLLIGLVSTEWIARKRKGLL